MVLGQGTQQVPTLLRAGDLNGEKKVPRPPHPHLLREKLLENPEWSLEIENMGFGVIWACVRIPTTSRLCDFKQFASLL